MRITAKAFAEHPYLMLGLFLVIAAIAFGSMIASNMEMDALGEEARKKALAQCIESGVQKGECLARLEAHHEACLRASAIRPTRYEPVETNVDQALYSKCVTIGRKALRKARAKEREEMRRQEALNGPAIK